MQVAHGADRDRLGRVDRVSPRTIGLPLIVVGKSLDETGRISKNDQDGESLDHRLAVAKRRWRFTGRQLAVLERLASGRRVSEIAKELGIVERTVRMHITGMLVRSRCRTRAELLKTISA